MNRAIIIVIVLMICVGIASAQDDAPDPQPTPDNAELQAEIESLRDDLQDAINQAEDASERASATLDFMDVGLGLLGAVGLLVTGGAAFASWVGFQRAIEQREELRKQLAEARESQSTFNNVVNQINAMKADIDLHMNNLNTFSTEIEGKINQQINRINDAQSLTQLAQLQISLGNIDAALKALTQACELDPENRINHYFLGDAYIRQGAITKGIEHLEQARSEPFSLLPADASYAYALRRLGDQEDDDKKREYYYADSLRIFLKLHDLAPNLLDASGESVFGAVAGIYSKRQESQDAIIWYKHVYSVTPHNSYPLNNLGLLTWSIGNTEEAKTYFRESVEKAEQKIRITPSDYWAWFDKITGNVALGQDKTLLFADLKRLFNLNPGAESLGKFQRGLEKLGQHNPPTDLREVLNRVRTEESRVRQEKSAPTYKI